MKTGNTYKSKIGEKKIIELYNRQLQTLNIQYEDLYVKTRFGKSHLIKLGNLNSKPLLMFHGGNSTTPFYLSGFKYLFEHFCIYAVDTIGHPGKSDQINLSAKSLEYGEWASDVIESLDFKKMNCMGGSFGGGVLVKLMCVAPEKIGKAVLIVPSGIANVSTFNITMKMGLPMMLYILTKKDYWLKKSILPIAINEINIDDETYEMVKSSFEYVQVKTGMPSNVNLELLKKGNVPILVMPAEKDCMFPGKNIVKKVEKTLPHFKIHLLKNQGHMFKLSVEEMNMIKIFLEE